MRTCPFCAEAVPADAAVCPCCASRLSEAAVGEGAEQFSHSGSRYLLGYGPGIFGIWDRQVPGGPVRTFPRTDEGWVAAWTAFEALEPNSAGIGIGRGRRDRSGEERGAAGSMSGGAGVAGVAGVPWDRAPAGAQAVTSLASPLRRLVASVVDVLALSAGLAAAISAGVFGGVNPANPHLTTGMIVAAGLLDLVYSVALIALWGQTLGMMLLRIRVVRRETGRPPDWGRALVRFAVPAVMGIVPLLGMLAYAWMLWDPLRQGLHDKAAGTLVVVLR